MVEFSQSFPKQYFDEESEEHKAVMFGTGLTIGGFKHIDAM